jgi:hypothetical protein
VVVKVARCREECGHDIDGERSNLRWTRKECWLWWGLRLVEVAIDSQLRGSGGGGVGGHDEEVEAKVEPEDTPAMRCWLRRKEAVLGLRN